MTSVTDIWTSVSAWFKALSTDDDGQTPKPPTTTASIEPPPPPSKEQRKIEGLVRLKLITIVEETVFDHNQLTRLLQTIKNANSLYLSLFDCKIQRRHRRHSSHFHSSIYSPKVLKEEIVELLLSVEREQRGVKGLNIVKSEEELQLLCLYFLWSHRDVREITASGKRSSTEPTNNPSNTSGTILAKDPTTKPISTNRSPDSSAKFLPLKKENSGRSGAPSKGTGSGGSSGETAAATPVPPTATAVPADVDPSPLSSLPKSLHTGFATMSSFANLGSEVRRRKRLKAQLEKANNKQNAIHHSSDSTVHSSSKSSKDKKMKKPSVQAALAVAAGSGLEVPFVNTSRWFISYRCNEHNHHHHSHSKDEKEKDSDEQTHSHRFVIDLRYLDATSDLLAVETTSTKKEMYSVYKVQQDLILQASAHLMRKLVAKDRSRFDIENNVTAMARGTASTDPSNSDKIVSMKGIDDKVYLTQRCYGPNAYGELTIPLPTGEKDVLTLQRFALYSLYQAQCLTKRLFPTEAIPVRLKDVEVLRDKEHSRKSDLDESLTPIPSTSGMEFFVCDTVVKKGIPSTPNSALLNRSSSDSRPNTPRSKAAQSPRNHQTPVPSLTRAATVPGASNNGSNKSTSSNSSLKQLKLAFGIKENKKRISMNYDDDAEEIVEEDDDECEVSDSHSTLITTSRDSDESENETHKRKIRCYDDHGFCMYGNNCQVSITYTSLIYIGSSSLSQLFCGDKHAIDSCLYCTDRAMTGENMTFDLLLSSCQDGVRRKDG